MNYFQLILKKLKKINLKIKFKKYKFVKKKLKYFRFKISKDIIFFLIK